MDKEINKIKRSETRQMGKLKTIVANAIEDEKLIVENLISPPVDILSKGQKVSNKVANFGGSWTFIFGFFIFFLPGFFTIERYRTGMPLILIRTF